MLETSLSSSAAAAFDVNAPLGANWTVHWFIHRTEEYGLLTIINGAIIQA